jgi:hypothetical protein
MQRPPGSLTEDTPRDDDDRHVGLLCPFEKVFKARVELYVCPPKKREERTVRSVPRLMVQKRDNTRTLFDNLSTFVKGVVLRNRRNLLMKSISV